jgi:hypothetical protein
MEKLPLGILRRDFWAWIRLLLNSMVKYATSTSVKHFSFSLLSLLPSSESLQQLEIGLCKELQESLAYDMRPNTLSFHLQQPRVTRPNLSTSSGEVSYPSVEQVVDGSSDLTKNR